MGKIYEKADAELMARVNAVMRKHHPELVANRVKLDVLLAFAGESSSPPVSVGGYPAAAKIKIVSLKDRVAGRADAEMIIDGDRLPKWSDDRVDALIDHELTHLECVNEDDDAGRPKLRIRLHDHHFGWFTEVAKRHGSASFECEQAAKMFEQDGQYLFPFAQWADGQQHAPLKIAATG